MAHELGAHVRPGLCGDTFSLVWERLAPRERLRFLLATRPRALLASDFRAADRSELASLFERVPVERASDGDKVLLEVLARFPAERDDAPAYRVRLAPELFALRPVLSMLCALALTTDDAPDGDDAWLARLAHGPRRFGMTRWSGAVRVLFARLVAEVRSATPTPLAAAWHVLAVDGEGCDVARGVVTCPRADVSLRQALAGVPLVYPRIVVGAHAELEREYAQRVDDRREA